MEEQKVDAIYAVREAAERKTAAELELEDEPTPRTRAALLEAQLDLEAKTQDAIEACHECGHAHDPAAAHGGNNVIPFRRDRKTPHDDLKRDGA